MKDQVDYVHTRKETARILGVSVKTLQRMEARGELPRVQISPRIIGYRHSVIEKFLDARTAGAGA
ncbi:MAG TPA: helix-turn-helix domain-containing protein [Pseudolabrys sp.]